MQYKIFLFLILFLSCQQEFGSGCCYISETGRRELSEYEKCDIKFVTLSGRIEADTNNGNTEPRIPFGSFDVTGGFDETGFQIQLHGKDWNSEMLKLDWTLLELNHIPMQYVCHDCNGGNVFQSEFNYVVIMMKDVNMSRTTMWRTPKLILYGVGNGCFSPYLLKTWTFSATLERNDISQKIIGSGDLKIEPYWAYNHACTRK